MMQPMIHVSQTSIRNILSKADVKSIMYVAIRVGDDVPAAFALSTTKEIRHWNESDIALAKAVADQTGIAIRQAELYQKAESSFDTRSTGQSADHGHSRLVEFA